MNPEPLVKSVSIQEIFNSTDTNSYDYVLNYLYKYLYRSHDKSYVNSVLEQNNDHSSICTRKWLDTTYCVKCYDCEYDETCSICLECFFNSDHKGHTYVLSNTYNGCCDCGDINSWDPTGCCFKHSPNKSYDEKNGLYIFTNSFLMRLEYLLNKIIEYINNYFNEMVLIKEWPVEALVVFLNDLAESNYRYRYAINLFLSKETLKVWVLNHERLNFKIRKCLTSLYMTLMTSESFKAMFSSLYESIYFDLIATVKPDDDEFHLSNLSVQMFTYPNIAIKLIKEGFLDRLMSILKDKSLFDNEKEAVMFNKLDLNRYSMYLKIIHDIGYILNHQKVYELILNDENLQHSILNMLLYLNNMNEITIKCGFESMDHHGYELGYLVENYFHNYLHEFSKHCFSADRRETEKLIRFYKIVNDFIKTRLVLTQNNKKMGVSYHIPVARYFGYIFNLNLGLKCFTNHMLKECEKDEKLQNYMETYFPNHLNYEEVEFDIISLFDEDVIKYILKSTIEVIKFAYEVRNTPSFHNKELLNKCTENYIYYFETSDVTAMQIATMILGVKRRLSKLNTLNYIFKICLECADSREDEGNIDPEELSQTNGDFFDPSQNSLEEIEVDGENEEDTTSQFSRQQQMEDVECESLEVSNYIRLSSFYFIANCLLNFLNLVENPSYRKKPIKDENDEEVYHVIRSHIIYGLSSGQEEFKKLKANVHKWIKKDNLYMDAIDEVATVQISSISDKTYVNLKPEYYKMIDVIMHPNFPLNRPVSKDALKQNNSLLGGRVRETMSKKYNEFQDILLNSVDCNELFRYIMFLLTKMTDCEFGLNQQPFQSFQELMNGNGSENTFEANLDLITKNLFGFKGSENVILFMVKVLNLMIEKLPKPDEETTEGVIKVLEGLKSKVQIDLFKSCLSYTIGTLKEMYPQKFVKMMIEGENQQQEKRCIQRKYIEMMRNRTTSFPSKNSEATEEEALSCEDEVCIICSTKLDYKETTLLLCNMHNNSILRRCVRSNGNKGLLNYDIVTKTAMPLSSTMIGTCGHMAHQKCLHSHLKRVKHLNLIAELSLLKFSPYECPMCRTLCKYGIKIIPDRFVKEFTLFNSKPVKSQEEHRIVSKQIDDYAVSDCDCCENYEVCLQDEQERLRTTQVITDFRWKHRHTDINIPSPVYNPYDNMKKYRYIINNLCNANKLDDFMISESNNLFEEIIPNYKGKRMDLNCSYCTSFQLESIKMENYNCIAFQKYTNRIFPKLIEVKNERKVMEKRVYNYFNNILSADFKNKVMSLFSARGCKFDFNKKFTKGLTSEYTRAIFYHPRTFFGVQNWVRASSIEKPNEHLSLFYNEILNVITYKRELLNHQNSAYTQLFRKMYFCQSNPDKSYNILNEESLINHGLHLDPREYDKIGMKIAIPDISEAFDESWKRETNILRIFVERINEYDLRKIYNLIPNGMTCGIDELEHKEIKYPELLSMFEKVECMRDDWVNDGKIVPVEHGLLNFRRDRDFYSNMGYCMLTNPWSCDHLLEMISHITNRTEGADYWKEVVYYHMLLVSMQTMNRFIIDNVVNRYVDFINERSPYDEGCKRTKVKRDFLRAFVNKFLKEFNENGEFQCDVSYRLLLTDFFDHLNEFKVYNGYKRKMEAENPDMFNESPYFKMFIPLFTRLLWYATHLWSLHVDHVEQFTEPIPNSFESVIEGKFNDYSDADLENYLGNQICRLMEVRELHDCLNHQYEIDKIMELIQFSKSGLENEYDDNFPNDFKSEIPDNDNNVSSRSPIIKENKTDFNKHSTSQTFYEGMDITRRINRELYKNHCNVAFFETLKNQIPASIHILDFMDSNLRNNLEQLTFEENESFCETVKKIFDQMVEGLKEIGVIDKKETLGFESLVKQIYESVNLMLEVAFWSMNSVLSFSSDLCSTIKDSVNFEETVRFKTLYESLKLDQVVKPNLTKRIVNLLIREIHSIQMNLNRKVNMEVEPPIVSKYEYVDITKYLKELNWETIRSVSMRKCYKCGLKPCKPVICLLCGSIVCRSSKCCTKQKDHKQSELLSSIGKFDKSLDVNKLSDMYTSELRCHSQTCGGGECVFFSPYESSTLFVNNYYENEVKAIYSDRFGNSNLTETVYGPVKLSKVRTDKITKSLCNGSMSKELVERRFQHILQFAIQNGNILNLNAIIGMSQFLNPNFIKCFIRYYVVKNKPPKELRLKFERPTPKLRTGFRGNHKHGKKLYDQVYPTTKIPTAFVPRYPLDWRNAGRFIITSALSRIEGKRIYRVPHSLEYQSTPQCGSRCVAECSLSQFKCLCSLRNNDLNNHVSNIDNILMSFKGPIETKAPLFSVAHRIPRINTHGSKKLVMDKESYPEYKILSKTYKFPVFQDRIHKSTSVFNSLVSNTDTNQRIFDVRFN